MKKRNDATTFQPRNPSLTDALPRASNPDDVRPGMLAITAEDRIVRAPEFAQLLGGIHIETLNAWRAQPPTGFPPLPEAVQVGPNTVGWRASEVFAFIRALPRTAPLRRAPRKRAKTEFRQDAQQERRAEDAKA